MTSRNNVKLCCLKNKNSLKHWFLENVSHWSVEKKKLLALCPKKQIFLSGFSQNWKVFKNPLKISDFGFTVRLCDSEGKNAKRRSGYSFHPILNSNFVSSMKKIEKWSVDV